MYIRSFFSVIAILTNLVVNPWTLEPVAQSHLMVSDYLALLLFIGPDLHFGSRAAAPMEKFPGCLGRGGFVRPSVRNV